MYEIMIVGKRSIIAGKEDVVKGGIKRVYAAGPTMREEVELAPGRSIYHVTNAFGKIMQKGYSKDIMILRIDGEDVEIEEKKEVSVEEQVAQLTAKIAQLESGKKTTKKAKKQSIKKEPVAV